MTLQICLTSLSIYNIKDIQTDKQLKLQVLFTKLNRKTVKDLLHEDIGQPGRDKTLFLIYLYIT